MQNLHRSKAHLIGPQRLVWKNGSEALNMHLEIEKTLEPKEKELLLKKLDNLSAEQIKGLEEGVTAEKSIKPTAEKLANKIDDSKQTTDQLGHSLFEFIKNIEKIAKKDKKFEAYEKWETLREAITKVTIVKENGEWTWKIFVQDTPIFEEGESEEPKKDVEFSATPEKAPNKADKFPTEKLNKLSSAKKTKLEEGIQPKGDKKLLTALDVAIRFAEIVDPKGEDDILELQFHNSLYEGIKKELGKNAAENFKSIRDSIDNIRLTEKNGEWTWEIKSNTLGSRKAEETKAPKKSEPKKTEAPETKVPTAAPTKVGREETPEETKTKREQVLEGKREGTLQFSKEGRDTQEAYELLMKTTIGEMYPNAKAGNQVEIKRKGGHLVVAEFDGEEWKYTEDSLKYVPAGKRDRVRIYDGDTLTMLNVQADTTEKQQTADAPGPVLGLLEVSGHPKKNADWEEAARQAMNQQSEEFKQLDWSVDEEEDVKAYAKVLKSFNRKNKNPDILWIAQPSKNPRPEKEKIEAKREEKRKQEKKEAKRVTQKERKKQADENLEISIRNRGKLLKNEDYKVKKDIREIVDNEDLWDYYWTKGHMKGKGQIVRGFKILGIEEQRIRGILRDAINQGTVFTKLAGSSEDNIDFEDLLDASNDANRPIFKNIDGQPDSYNEFIKEFKAKPERQVFTRAGRGRTKKTNKYTADPEKRKERLAYMGRVLTGSALVLDGVNKLNPTMDIKKAEREMERAETEAELREKAEKRRIEREEENLKEGFEKGSRAKNNADETLADFFDPKDSGSLEGKLEEREQDIDASEFEAIFSGLGAYAQLKKECRDPETGKTDTKKLAKKMNELIQKSLLRLHLMYVSAKAGETTRTKTLHTRAGGKKTKTITEDSPMYEPTEQLAQRYFGDKQDLDELAAKYNFDDPDFAQDKLVAFGIQESNGQLSYLKNNRYFIKRLLEDGFAMEHKVEVTPLSEEVKEKTKNPDARALIEQLEADNKEFRELSEEEKIKVAEQINAYTSRKQEFKKESLFDINVAKDLNKPIDKQWQIGVSKNVLHIDSLDMDLGLGVAVNTNGEVMLGIMLAKNISISEQWSAVVKAAGGVELTNPKLYGGAGASLIWKGEVEEDSSWRNKFTIDAFLGGSAAFNLTDIRLGFATGLSFGQEKDAGAMYEKVYSSEYMNQGMHKVDAETTVEGKAKAIKEMPNIGKHLATAQEKMGWSPEELVRFYENTVKGGLEEAAFQKALDSASGISEYGIGVTIEPAKLIVLAAAIVAGVSPAGIAAISLAFFGRLGIVVGRTIETDRRIDPRTTERQMAVEQQMMEAIEDHFDVKIKVKAETYEGMDELQSAEFSGQNMGRLVGLPEGRKANKTNFVKFSPSESPEFKDMQKQFRQYGLELSINEKSNMYSLRLAPGTTELTRIYLDRTTMEGNGIIMNPKGEILIAGTDNLSNLYLKKFDTLYLPGEYEGAVQHTVITISSTPDRTMGQIAESGNYVELRHNIGTGEFTSSQIIGNQDNIITATQYNAMSKEERQERFLTTKNLSARQKEALKQNEEDKEFLDLQAEAEKARPQQLEKNISLEGLPVSPKDFMKKYGITYRKWTTGTADFERNMAELRENIRKENPGMTLDQIQLYEDTLFTLSMSEWKATVEQRITWAEKNVYTPYFEKKLEEMGADRPANISAAELARTYMAELRNAIRNGDERNIRPGESLFTSVGTKGIVGFRFIHAATGQGENTIIEGYDYAQWLSEGGRATDEKRYLIAKFLVEDHSLLNLGNETSKTMEDEGFFLKSRMAMKLFHLGDSENGLVNPLYKILGKEKAKDLIQAYKDIEQGKEPSIKAETAQDFYNICQKLREAQLGKGIAVTVDDKFGRAVLIGGYYFVISTKLNNAYFKQCKNPSDVYSESLSVFSPQEFAAAEAAPRATIAGGDTAVALSNAKSITTTAIGVSGVATKEFKFQRKKKPVEEEKEEPPEEDTPPPEEEEEPPEEHRGSKPGEPEPPEEHRGSKPGEPPKNETPPPPETPEPEPGRGGKVEAETGVQQGGVSTPEGGVDNTPQTTIGGGTSNLPPEDTGTNTGSNSNTSTPSATPKPVGGNTPKAPESAPTPEPTPVPTPETPGPANTSNNPDDIP